MVAKDIELELALTKQTMKNIEIKVEKIEQWMGKILEKFDDLPNHFATKMEHSINADKIRRIENWFFWILWIIWASIIGAILKVIWLLWTN